MFCQSTSASLTGGSAAQQVGLVLGPGYEVNVVKAAHVAMLLIQRSGENNLTI
jgi:hypothetical protein